MLESFIRVDVSAEMSLNLYRDTASGLCSIKAVSYTDGGDQEQFTSILQRGKSLGSYVMAHVCFP
jgi:hypothetical protein